MAPLVHLVIVLDRLGPVAPWWDDRSRTPFTQARPQLVAVKGFVAQEGTERQSLEQWSNAADVVPLPWQQDEVDEVPKRVDQGDDLCAQPAARAPDRLVLRPPFAPVAF